MQVFANCWFFFSVTSWMHWNLPEVCSCSKCACLMLLLRWVWNFHITPAAHSSSGLLSGYPAVLIPLGVQSKPHVCPGWERESLNTGQHQGWAHGALHSPKLWRTIFQGLPELLRCGWDQGEEMTELMFTVAHLLTYVKKHHGRDSQRHCGAHVISQASEFWLFLCPRERHKHRKAEKS